MAWGTRSLRPPFETTSPSGEAAAATEEGKSRRDVLKALGAAAAGAVAGGVLMGEQAEASHGSLNATSDNEFRPAVHGENTFPFGVAIVGSALPYGTGVSGRGGVGVYAFGTQTGVYVESHDFGLIVNGLGDGVGRGVSVENANVGVRAVGQEVGVEAITFSSTGAALRVRGKASFSTAGKGTILADRDSASVSDTDVTALSHVTVTLTGDPGQASSAPGSKPVVVWVERQPGTGFIVHLSRAVRFATPFTYLIVEPV